MQTPELEIPLELNESFLDFSSQSSIENKVDSLNPVPMAILPYFSSPNADNSIDLHDSLIENDVNLVTPDTIPILPNVSTPLINDSNSSIYQPSNTQSNSQAQPGDNENEQEIDYDLKTYRVKNVGKIIMATLNINSIRNKFEQLKMLISGNIDVLVITETKLDDSFPTGQFFIEGFSIPFRLDRNKHGGGILIYIREDIPSKELTKHTFNDGIEGIFLELNFNKYKLLVLGTYHPPNQNNDYYLNSISNSLDLYLGDYERFILLGDFNIQDSDTCLMEFNSQYDSKNIVRDPTCFKSINNPTTIDLIITNLSRSCINTKTFINSLSDFHTLSCNYFKHKIQQA